MESEAVWKGAGIEKDNQNIYRKYFKFN